jgi:hypothetical protein
MSNHPSAKPQLRMKSKSRPRLASPHIKPGVKYPDSQRVTGWDMHACKEARPLWGPLPYLAHNNGADIILAAKDTTPRRGIAALSSLSVPRYLKVCAALSAAGWSFLTMAPFSHNDTQSILRKHVKDLIYYVWTEEQELSIISLQGKFTCNILLSCTYFTNICTKWARRRS